MWAPKLLPLESRKALWDAHHRDETACVEELLSQVQSSAVSSERIAKRARTLITQIRNAGRHPFDLDAFMQEYELSTPEGVALMCLAEALLRIPDAATQDALIKDKIGAADWSSHEGHGGLFVNASTWALKMTGRLVDRETFDDEDQDGWRAIAGFAARAGDAVVREAVLTGMKILGRKFVLGESIDEALKNAETFRSRGYGYSFDMLGEAAVTAAQAQKHFDQYAAVIGRLQPGDEISIKLSALHVRYEPLQAVRVIDELVLRVLELAEQAADVGIGLCIDAEESERLDLSLDVLDRVSGERKLRKWNGLSVAVQAYQKRALPLIGWLEQLAERDKRRLKVRLVKGAYWDREIKRAQVLGLDGFPVFTRKMSSDVSFLACAQRLMARPDVFYPAFASCSSQPIKGNALF